MSARYGVDLKLNYYRACEHLVVDQPAETPISIELSNFEFISCCN